MKLKLNDHVMLAGQMKEIMLEGESLKSDLLECWKNNIDFVNGNQIVNWDPAIGRFKTNTIPMGVKKSSNDYIYVTNELTPIDRTIRSFLTRHKPTVTVYPSDPEDDYSVRRARVAEGIQWAKWEMDKEQAKHEELVGWALACGTVFRKDSWNSSARGIRAAVTDDDNESGEKDEADSNNREFQQAIADSLPKPTENESPEYEMGEGPSHEEAELHWGDSEVSVLTGFNINVDFDVKDDDFTWIEQYSLEDLEWVKSNYNRKNEFYTGRCGELKGTDNFGNALRIDLAMRFKTNHSTGKSPKIENKCLFREFYQKPRGDAAWNKGKKYNEWAGTMIVMANDTVLYVGPSPYNHNGKIHPYTPFHYEPYLGRFWGRSLWEQLIPLQCRLNELNGAITKNAKLMAKPKWMALEGTIDEGVLNGSEDKSIFYKLNPAAGDVVPPTMISGRPLPTQFFNERQMIIDTMVRIPGANLIGGDNLPQGMTAASALNLAIETSGNKLGPLVNRNEKFIEQGQTAKLVLFQKMCREDRKDIFEFLKKKKKDLTELDVEAFSGETIEDNLTVEVEAGSSIPKSNSARQAQLLDLAGRGVLGDIVNDPVANQQFLSEFGVTEFNKKTNAEWEKIKWENSRLLKGMPASPSERDDHDFHLSEHIPETQKPSYIEQASDMVKFNYEEHIAFHEQKIRESQEAAENQKKGQMIEVAQTDKQMEIEKKAAEEQAKAERRKQEILLQDSLEIRPEIYNYNQ